MDDLSGWYPDPTGRHQERYFNAAGIPTNFIRNDGLESTDEDRAAGAAPRADEPHMAAQGASNAPSAMASAGTTVASDGAPRAPVARYTAPEPDPRPDEQTGRVAAVSLPPPAPDSDRRHSLPWLIAAVCVLGLLAIGTTAFALQQHSQANKWRNDYQAEVTRSRSETHKSTGLFLSLLSAQHNLSLVTFQKDAICQKVNTFLLHPDPTITAACTG